jgi:hypothetical protein
MDIQGVCILSQHTVFSPTGYGIAAWVIIVCFTFFFTVIWLGEMENWAGPPCLICFALFVICMALNFTNNSKTFLNHPSKIEYTIEITDDNAWKELGPNYTVKEKLYEMKEIYVIEGDYVDDNT